MRPFIVHLICLIVLQGGTGNYITSGIDPERIPSEAKISIHLRRPPTPENKKLLTVKREVLVRPITTKDDGSGTTVKLASTKRLTFPSWTLKPTSPINSTTTDERTTGSGDNDATPYDLNSGKKSDGKKSDGKKSGITKELLSLAVINIALGVACLLLSIAILAYYRKESDSLVPVLYFRNGLTDLFCGIGVLIQCLALCLTAEDVSHVTIPVLISYIVTTVAVRMSVFMNCVLGVVRCIKIVKPFYAVNKKAVTISTLIYLAIWILIVAADLWRYIAKIGLENKLYLVKSLVLKPEPGFSVLSVNSKGDVITSLSQLEVVSITYSIPVALPALLCFVMMLLQVYHLLTLRKQPTHPSNSNAGQHSSRTAQNQKSAITILILTVIFVVTSTVSIVVWLAVYRANLMTRGRIQILSWTELGIIYFSHSTCPLLCSTLTPLTLFVRCTAMRRAVTHLAHSGMKSIEEALSKLYTSTDVTTVADSAKEQPKNSAK